MDDDNSKSLDLAEFTKAITDYRVGIDESLIKTVFRTFDIDGSGSVDYDEFLRMVRGEMNDFRKKLVQKAFNKLDKDGNGVLEVSDIKDVYSAKNHPDVKSGKKTEEEILGEFLETFEMHMNLGGGTRDRTITPEEFEEYYNNVSASVDDDRYFEHMMNAAWKLQGAEPKKAAWKEDYAGGSPAVKTQSRKQGEAPYGTSDTPVDYGGKTQASFNEEVKESCAAGQSSRPKTAKNSGKEDSAKLLADSFRQCLVSRGARGIFGIQRVFKVKFVVRIQ